MTIRREIQAGQEVLAARTTRNTLTIEAKSNRIAGLIGTMVMGDAGLCVGVLSTFVSARNMIFERDPEDFVRIYAEQLTNGKHVASSCAYSVPTNLSPAAKEVVVFPVE